MEARRAHNPEVVGSSPASATIRMYAHVDGKSTVGVGVDFCHVRPDYFGKVFVVPLVDAGAEEGHQGRRVKFTPGGGSPGDYVLQL